MPRRDVFLFSVFALLSTSCDLWNAYRAADPNNCTLNADLCTANETCSATTGALRATRSPQHRPSP